MLEKWGNNAILVVRDIQFSNYIRSQNIARRINLFITNNVENPIVSILNCLLQFYTTALVVSVLF